MTERGADFDARREAYFDARWEMSQLIDNPDKTLTADQYRDKLKAAKRKCHTKHGDMLAAWG